MARFQLGNPVIKDEETQTEVRKMGSEFISKLNILSQNFKTYNDLTQVSTGLFTPTVTTVANISTITPFAVGYTATKYAVTVGGAFTATLTSVGAATSFRMSLPIGATFTSASSAGGAAVNGPSQAYWSIKASTTGTNDVIFESFGICPTVSLTYQFTFTYQVL